LDADVFAVNHGAVDHRIVNVGAASKNEILETNAISGFVGSVTQLNIGMMFDLGRSVDSYVVQFLTKAGNWQEAH
jgi:phosphoglycerate dehydrogenase-like enzyme|tara:strand:- start:330 stop:554 length:225 start_codon:yes stop_codon:yes gene_type:complete